MNLIYKVLIYLVFINLAVGLALDVEQSINVDSTRVDEQLARLEEHGSFLVDEETIQEGTAAESQLTDPNFGNQISIGRHFWTILAKGTFPFPGRNNNLSSVEQIVWDAISLFRTTLYLISLTLLFLILYNKYTG